MDKKLELRMSISGDKRDTSNYAVYHTLYLKDLNTIQKAIGNFIKLVYDRQDTESILKEKTTKYPRLEDTTITIRFQEINEENEDKNG